eukprot:1174473-Prorocentrum_minimum.AAC.4
MLLFVIPQLTTHGLAQAEPTDFWQVPESSTLQLAPGLDDERTLTNFKYAMYLKVSVMSGCRVMDRAGQHSSGAPVRCVLEIW